jgi:hypothetical protein
MNDKPTIAPLGDLPDQEPTENSSLEELAAYALDKQNGILASDKTNGEDLWLMGQALEWAYKKTPYGEWEDWFKSQVSMGASKPATCGRFKTSQGLEVHGPRFFLSQD